MKEEIKVSVVIPVWNPGEGIVKCIASLRAQTLQQIEMLFVDDRGTDRAVEHIRAAAAEDPRIRLLVNPENRGPGYSRNVGIEAAQGQYLSFVDPDDYLAVDYMERLYFLACREDLDIAKGRIVYEKEDGTVAPHHEQNNIIRTGLQKGKPIYAIFSYEHHSAIYRREMLLRSGARYGLARRAQDTTFLLRAGHAARTMGIDDGAVYYFRERGDSAMHVYNISSLRELRFSFQEQVDYLSTALAEDEYAPAYSISKLLSSLRFSLRYVPMPENEQAIQAFCAGMREQVLRLPYAQKMAERCFPVRALMDHRALLPLTPFYLPWERASAQAWLDLLGRWTDYLCEHPNDANKAASKVFQICYQAEKAGEEEQLRQEVRARIGREMAKLPRFMRIALWAAKVASRLPKSLRTLLSKWFNRG